jgi:hypothetical protein
MKYGFKTIVGGRSAEQRDQNNYPRGIEILLKKAKVDPAFQKLFLEDPLAAAKSIDLDLKESEKKILKNTLKPVLKTMIDNTFVPKHHVKTFLTAQTAAVLAFVLTSCVTTDFWEEPKTFGIEAPSEKIHVEKMIYRIEITEKRLASVQNALEQYKLDHGSYPSTEEWLRTTNPLNDYINTGSIFDPWKRKFHYKSVKENNTIVNYKLESYGENIKDINDNITCPIDTEKHQFYLEDPIDIIYPQHNEIININIKEDGTGQTVALQATHESVDSNIDWYIDGTKIGSTFKEHKLPVKLESGEHLLHLIDEHDNNVCISFYVLLEE